MNGASMGDISVFPMAGCFPGSCLVETGRTS
jgi:hypothetical protein